MSFDPDPHSTDSTRQDRSSLKHGLKIVIGIMVVAALVITLLLSAGISGFTHAPDRTGEPDQDVVNAQPGDSDPVAAAQDAQLRASMESVALAVETALVSDPYATGLTLGSIDATGNFIPAESSTGELVIKVGEGAITTPVYLSDGVNVSLLGGGAWNGYVIQGWQEGSTFTAGTPLVYDSANGGFVA